MNIPYRDLLIRSAIGLLVRLLPPEDSLSKLIAAHAEASLKADAKEALKIAQAQAAAMVQSATFHAGTLVNAAKAGQKDAKATAKGIIAPLDASGASILVNLALDSVRSPAPALEDATANRAPRTR